MKQDNFKYEIDRFADIKIMRYKVPGFEQLSLDQKLLIYYLSQAALCGRDIIYDVNYKHNLKIRKTLEELYSKFKGDRNTDNFKAFEIYLKKIWFSNGIHHHYSMDKFKPDFSIKYFVGMFHEVPDGEFPLGENEEMSDFVAKIGSLIFDPDIAPKRVSLDHNNDLLLSSACNYYEGVSEEEAVAFYNKLRDLDNDQPVSYGLNSRLIKENGALKELVYKVGGLFSPALEKIIFWLEKASAVSENVKQKKVIDKLIEFYQSGDLKKFDEYSILWVNDLDSHIDFVNGFIEVYGDPLGIKASWESIVNFKDVLATKRAEIISANAKWFEDHSPVNEEFKKKEVKGVSAKVINIAHLGGDCYPATPIGINLPNADWIRKEYGSKSVTIENITYAYDQASKDSGSLEEFCFDRDEIDIAKKYGFLASNIHTDLHECLGHGSGQLLSGVAADSLKNYSSTLEEARADLFALYYMMDDKMQEIGLFETKDVAKAEYNSFMRNGLMTQLKRIELGKDVEESHMRNRQLIAKWCFEKGKSEKVIEYLKKGGKTFIKINDYEKLRGLFGELLGEVQRIKSEGDYQAGKELVEQYAVKIDIKLHEEVITRFEKLNLASFGGFVNPEFLLKMENETIKDVEINYPDNYIDQMLKYSKEYSYL